MNTSSLYREIPLTRGLVTLVDAKDYDFLMQWKWHARPSFGYYACRAINGPRIDGKRSKTSIQMHNAILPPPEGYQIDHINHDTLDNRRHNLRIATATQNMRNRRKWRKPTSAKYKGVCWHKQNQYWQAQIKVDYKAVYLGVFQTAEAAALAYNEAAVKHFGEYAQLNTIESCLV